MNKDDNKHLTRKNVEINPSLKDQLHSASYYLPNKRRVLTPRTPTKEISELPSSSGSLDLIPSAPTSSTVENNPSVINPSSEKSVAYTSPVLPFLSASLCSSPEEPIAPTSFPIIENPNGED